MSATYGGAGRTERALVRAEPTARPRRRDAANGTGKLGSSERNESLSELYANGGGGRVERGRGWICISTRDA